MAGEVALSNIELPTLFYQKSLYDASKLLSNAIALVPSKTTPELEINDWITVGDVGENDVAFRTKSNYTTLKTLKVTAKIAWDKYSFAIPDSTKIKARKGYAINANELQSGAEFFAAATDYKILKALKDAVYTATNQIAATALWTADTADIETDIVKAWSVILENSNASMAELNTMKIYVPVAAYAKLNLLQLINNIQQQLKEYLKQSFSLSPDAIVPYRPYKDKDNITKMDALGTSTVVVVPGMRLGTYYRYDPAEATRLGAPLNETWREPDHGNFYVQWLGHGMMVYPESRVSETLTTRIAEITGVVS